MSARPVVWVTRRLPQTVERALEEHFLVRAPHDDAPFPPDALARAFREADAVLCTVTDRVTAECFTQEGRRTAIVANFGVGVNHIALAAARAAGVKVTNTPDVLTDDTADIALLLMLAVLRRTSEGERELRAGRWTGWQPTHLLGSRLGGKTLGIVGLGRIGSAVARRAYHGFGMRVAAWSRTPRLPDGMAFVELAPSLTALLAQCDVLTLHCPATPDTHHLIGASELARMRPGAVLVNTARGDVVDEAALVAALASGHLGGAGLDVFEREPEVHAGLLGRENVVLLPHLGSATLETRAAMGMRALANLTAFFDGIDPPDRVA